MQGGSATAHLPAMPQRMQRLDWVDALKGLAVLAVVAGHVWTRGPLRDAIYAVHMPLFFILSGYTARFVPWGALLRRCALGLLLPFLIFSALLLAMDFWIEGERGMLPIFASWQQGVWTILFETAHTRGPFTILWFIPCLIIARLIWNALLMGGRRVDSRGLVMVMLAIYIVSLLAHQLGGASPLGLLAVPGAVLMMWVGALWHDWGQPDCRQTAMLTLMTLAAFIIPLPVNMKLGDFGWLGLSLFTAAAATIMLAALVRRLPSVLMAPLVWLGSASMVIMYLHVAFAHYLAPYAPRVILFAIAVAAPLVLHRLLRLSPVTRLILLGEKSPSLNPIGLGSKSGTNH